MIHVDHVPELGRAQRRRGHFGMARTLLRPRRWRRIVRVSGAVRESPTFLWREVNRRLVTGRYHLRGSDLVVHLRHDTPDLGGLFEVFVQRSHDPPGKILAVLRHERPLRVADLGGNIGLFALRVLQRFPNAQLTSFEPDPANARVLALTAAANGVQERWRLVGACAGATPSVVPFLTGQYLESQILAQGDSRGQLLPKIDVFPHLDGVDWLKIDIEGGEWELLADPRFTELTVPVLWLEYHRHLCPCESPRALATEALARAGYQIVPFVERAPGIGELWAWRP